MIKIIFISIFFIISLYGEDINIVKEEYKIIDLGERIKSIKVSNKDILYVKYNKNTKRAFTQLTLYGKEYGRVNIFVTYSNNESESIWVNVQHDLNIIKSSLKNINSNIEIEEYDNNKFILKGNFKNIKEKNSILKILNSADINSSKDIVDMSKILNTPTIAKIKMYIVEMSNQNLNEFKSKTVIEDIVGDTLVNITMIDDQSLTLDGMFTAVINKMGSKFNLTNALKILKQNQLANILDESTLTVMEGEESEFHSGGVIRVKIQGTTKEGQPINTLEKILYGISINIKLEEVKENGSMLMSINTDNTTINWDQQVDGIPGFGEKSVKTKLTAHNNQAIILSGLVSSEDSKIVKKIPLLGDIPILGKLFRSESFKKGKSELMFFLIPSLDSY